MNVHSELKDDLKGLSLRRAMVRKKKVSKKFVMPKLLEGQITLVGSRAKSESVYERNMRLTRDAQFYDQIAHARRQKKKEVLK